MKYILIAAVFLLLAVLAVSGCVQEPTGGGQDQLTGNVQDNSEQLALEELKKELEQATGDIDLGDLENSLLE